METILLKRTALPVFSVQKFRKNSCTPNLPSFLSPLHPSCLPRAISSRELVWHSNSHCLRGGNLNEVDRTSWASQQRTNGLTCRANTEGIDPLRSNPHEGASDDSAGGVSENRVLQLIRACGNIVSANFLIVALSSSIILGLAWPAPGRAAQQMGLSKWCTSAIFVLSGLNIRSGDTDKAVAAWPAGLFGLIVLLASNKNFVAGNSPVSVLLITPLAAIPILSLQTSPRELVTGLAIFACVPTTLSSAVCLTQIAGANTTLALGMTVFSNLISIVTMPFTLTTLVGGGIGVSIPPGPLLRSLIQTLLIPLVLGKVLREAFSVVAKFVDGNRLQVSMITSFIQGLVPWMQLSSSKVLLLQIEPSNLLLVVAAGMALHIVYLATNLMMMQVFPAACIRDDYNSRAVLLVTSQKSIVVAIAVIDRLGGAFGNAGLLVLPCIATQLSQVTVDSILVNNWLQSDAREKVRATAA